MASPHAADPEEKRFSFLIFELDLWVQESVQNDPEVRGVILTKCGPKQSHLDPILANVYDFLDPTF